MLINAHLLMKQFSSPRIFIFVLCVICCVYQCRGQIENGAFNPSGENIRRVVLPVSRPVPVNREEPRRIVIFSTDTDMTETGNSRTRGGGSFGVPFVASQFSSMTSMMSMMAMMAMALVLAPAIIQTMMETMTTPTTIIIQTTPIATTTPGISTATGRGMEDL
ncbi:Hypothetical predicted protein [Mytilus galloprovincialis]|uniref:Uncharacterized protein n=1 Tax=Mytilus galloprovincialis TaxID=29158 RepID=A0A8B6CYU7_MYTGA|nr:Hypothetical predicted protein [Mytilus galloprovincialis]